MAPATTAACGEFDLTLIRSNCAAAPKEFNWASVKEFVSTVNPSWTASQALVSRSLAESNWRGRFVLSSETTRPAKRQSLVGIVAVASMAFALPVQFVQIARSTPADFK